MNDEPILPNATIQFLVNKKKIDAYLTMLWGIKWFHA